MMICDRVLALCELSQDLLFHKIPAGRLGFFVDSSLSAGEAAARKFHGRNIVQLYGEYGITVEHHERSGSKFGVTLRGQAIMGDGEYSVVVYTDSIRALAEYSACDGLPEIDYDSALQAHLAHEFFHFWEYKTGTSIIQELDSVETFKLFGFSRKAKINRCGEAAAHMFAKTMIGLPCLPNLYDYLYLIRTGKMSRESFDIKIASLEQMLASHSNGNQ